MRRDMKTGATRRLDRDCGLPPGDENFDLKVNMPELVETRGKTTTFARVADLRLDRGTVRAVTRRARRHRAIENETFKTLKSGDMQGFERNCGHDGNHPRDVFGSPCRPFRSTRRGKAAAGRSRGRCGTRGGISICGTNREVRSAGSPFRPGRRSLRLSRAR